MTDLESSLLLYGSGYEMGKHDERERILKLIDEKIFKTKTETTLFWIGYKEALNELKEELEK